MKKSEPELVNMEWNFFKHSEYIYEPEKSNVLTQQSI